MPGRKKRRSKSTLARERCDTIWGQIIRASNGGLCKLAGQDNVRCGGPIQGAHCFGRGFHGARHELWNGVPLCSGHHVHYTRRSGAAEAWTAILIGWWGLEVYERRYAEAKAITKPDYAAIAAELQSHIKSAA